MNTSHLAATVLAEVPNEHWAGLCIKALLEQEAAAMPKQLTTGEEACACIGRPGANPLCHWHYPRTPRCTCSYPWWWSWTARRTQSPTILIQPDCPHHATPASIARRTYLDGPSGEAGTENAPHPKAYHQPPEDW